MAIGDRGDLRLARAVRNQVRLQAGCLDDLIGEDHRARQVWAYVQGLDLTALYEAAKAVEGEPGRPLTDPAILTALWLYATLEGIGSARQLARLCETDAAYLWLLGDVTTNHRTLSGFRVAAGPALDEALTQSVASLVHAGVVSLEVLAVDGVRVRASAGKNSFKRKAKLTDLLALAKAKVETLKAELDDDPAACSKRTAARRMAVAQDRQRRIEKALATVQSIEEERLAAAERERRKAPQQSKGDAEKGPKASFTDPDARVMRMPDGGYRPAYNVQFTTEAKTGLVVGVETINNGSDRGRIGAAVEQVKARYGAAPGEMLADGGYDSKTDIGAVEQGGTQVYCPLPKNDAPKKKDPEGVTAWRERMSSQEGKAGYARRIPCERPHADARNRGLTAFTVRGAAKVGIAVLWFIHAYNLLTALRLNA